MNTILILGATSDIAQSIANVYASQGYRLYLAGRSADRLNPIKTDLAIRYKADIAVYEFDAAQSHEEHMAFYNSLPAPPDLAICVFGYLGDQEEAQKNWLETSRILTANYVGAISILNIIANDMEARQTGQIIGISSVAGERGRQSNYLYGSAKAGFSTYLSGLRNRLCKHGVHVMTVKPGFMNTRMTSGLNLPKPLTAEPDVVAHKIVKAASKNVNTIYILPIWKWIMLIIKMIPEPIFKKMKL